VHGPPAVGVEPDGPCRNNAPTIRHRPEARWHSQRRSAELPDGSQTIEVAGAEPNPVFPNQRSEAVTGSSLRSNTAVAAVLKNGSVEKPGDEDTDARRLWIYEQLIRTEAHWTQQLQNQQTRINTTLTVNGIMLAFVAGNGLLLKSNGFPRDTSLASISALALGVLFGVLALNPRTRIEEHHYISSSWLKKSVTSKSPKSLLDELNGSFDDTSAIRNALERRRSLLIGELLAIAVGTVLLVIALDESRLWSPIAGVYHSSYPVFGDTRQPSDVPPPPPPVQGSICDRG
jgi:hypothetical protein